ncbi:MAG: SDR family oxidoreductase, partial [Pirellulales bacterium]
MPKRLIVLTGTSRGLGRAMTARFVERGHLVAGCCRSADAVTDLRQTYAEPNRFDVVDVADDDAVRGWAELLLADWGVPDLLINNAALINANAPLWRVPSEEFSRLVDVNVKGVYHTIRHFVPAMIERGSGVVVNISSSWGRSTAPDVAPYCASKWAVEGLT